MPCGLTRGARLGYLLKERVGRVEEFLDALHRVAGGGTAVDPEVDDRADRRVTAVLHYLNDLSRRGA
jgi:hypothetical protein